MGFVLGVMCGGCLVSIALGFSGALIGTWLARAVALPALFRFSISRDLLREKPGFASPFLVNGAFTGWAVL
jgi:hypothetical protein